MESVVRFECCRTYLPKWLLLLPVMLLLFACAPSRNAVQTPPEWQHPSPPAATTAKPEGPTGETATAPQQPVIKPPPQITESEVPESGGTGATASGMPPRSSAANSARSSDPQYLASMHLVDQAKASLAQGDADNAISALEQAIQVDVYNGEAFLELARAWNIKGSQPKALEFANKAEILFQDDPRKLKQVYLFKAELFKQLNDMDRTNYYLQKAARLD